MLPSSANQCILGKVCLRSRNCASYRMLTRLLTGLGLSFPFAGAQIPLGEHMCAYTVQHLDQRYAWFIDT